MARKFDRKIVFEDGSEYLGYGFGARCDAICEASFCTSMVGYQELISNPSCTYQMVTMTYPLIGNYGIADDDFESKTPTIGGLIVREYNDTPSNFRYTKTLSEILEENNIPAISGVDTRMIMRSLRNSASQKVMITDITTTKENALSAIRAYEIPKDAVSKVSCKKKWYSRTSNPRFNLVAVDCGVKLNIIRNLNARGCNVTVVPFDTTADEINALKPDGVFISNGPGNPENAKPVIELVRSIRGKYPIFGIGLGHQIISLAFGASTYKLKFGHSGGNHPVRNLKTGKIEITSQGHGYAVDSNSIDGTGLEITHVNVLDNTVEGVCCAPDKVFSVQYQPESAPGPQDSTYVFDEFIKLMEGKKNA